MTFQSFSDRLQGKIRRTLCTYCARRPVQIKLPHPVVSFTFDDFPASAYQAGGAILEKYGLAGTYYASLGLAGRDGPVGRFFSESLLPELLAHGHELGCHTFDHHHAWLTSPQEYERSIIRNRQRLEQILPDSAFTSHAFPKSYARPSNKAIMSKYFPFGRGCGQSASRGTDDANFLAAFFIEKSRDNLPTITAQIDQAKSTSSWLIFATHDICDAPSPFGCRPELFEAIVRYTVEAGIKVLPAAQAFALLPDTGWANGEAAILPARDGGTP